MNAYPIGNDLTVKWSLLYSDGSVFPLSNYDYELSYRTNRGNKVVTDTSVISVDENILTWTFKGDEQVVSGRYTICLKITLSGSKVVELQYDNAFMLSPLSGFKGAGSEIVLQSYCDAIDLKDAVLQARKAMDIAANALVDTANSARDAKAAKAAAEVTAAQAKADAESAKTMAADAKDKVAVAEKAATDASRDAVAAQRAAQTASDHITSLQQAIAELPDGQAVTEKVAEHTIKLTELESKTDKNSIVSVESNNILQGAIYKDGSFHDDGSGWEYVLFLVAPNDKITFKASGYRTNVISFYALGQPPSANTYIEGMLCDGNGPSSYKEYNAIAKDFLIAAVSWYRPYGTPSISIKRTSLIDNLDSIIKDYEEKFSMTESELRRKQNVIKNISETGTEENSSSLIIYDDKDNKISEVDANICDEEDEEQIWESEGGDKYASIGNYGIKAKAFEDLDGNKFLAHNADISNLNILIFGDSITDCTNIGLDETNIRTTSYSYNSNGYNNEQGQYVTFKMWAYMLNSILKCKDLRCYARSGATWKDSPTGGLTDGYTNLREMMSYQVRLAINDLDNPNSVFPTQGRYNPDIIICALGTNDGLNKNDTYESAMEKTMYKEDGKTIDIDATLQNLDRTKFCEAVRWSLLTLKQNFPYAILMVVLPLQRADFEQGRNAELRRMAERYGAVIIDGYSEMGIIRDTETTNNNVDLGDTTITINSGIYLKDGLHPNDKGQNLFARLIISYIKRYYVSFDGMNV